MHLRRLRLDDILLRLLIRFLDSVRRDTIPFRINVREDAKVVEVHHSGLVNAQEACQARDAVMGLVTDHGLAGVLINLRDAMVSMSVTSSYRFQREGAPVFPPGTRIAIVCDGQNWPARDAKFAETVAVNSGRLFRLFKEPDDALAWLNGAHDPADGTCRP